MRDATRRLLAWLLEVRARASSRRVGVALCYHAIGDRPGDPARELMAPVALDAFQRQLAHLRRHYHVVPASRLLTAVRTRQRWQRIPVAVTFDDDLRSHLSHAVPALRRAGLPATFFLGGAGLEAPISPWWHLLQRAWDRGLVDKRLLRAWGVREGARDPKIRDAAQRLQAMSRADRERAEAQLRAVLEGEVPREGLDASAVRGLARAGMEVGFHTRDHHALTALDDTGLRAALVDGRHALERVVGRRLAVIAYPHGLADYRVAAEARAADYAYGFTTSADPIDAHDDPLLLGRRYPARGGDAAFVLDLARAARGRARTFRR